MALCHLRRCARGGAPQNPVSAQLERDELTMMRSQRVMA